MAKLYLSELQREKKKKLEKVYDNLLHSLNPLYSEYNKVKLHYIME